MRRTPLTASALALVLALTACNDHDVAPFEEQVSSERADIVALFGNNKVDVLWVIDNSGSMCEEQQSLRQNFDAFVAGLVEANIDFNLAVVTTDMSDPRQRGRFQNTAHGEGGPACEIALDVAGCPAEGTPRVIRSSDPRYHDEQLGLDVAAVQRDFGCNATVGVAGDGFEMGLDAARAAFAPELLEDHNSGFLRDDALLAVVFLTDENDCSGADPSNLTNGNICEWDRDRLTPIEDYVAFFGGLKSDPSEVIVAAIKAPDDGLRYAYGEEVLPSCVSSSGEGYSGYRYGEFARAFAHHAEANICAPDQFDRALEAISGEIVQASDRRCLLATPLTCVSDADCGGGSCTSRGGQSTFCDNFTIQVELRRPAGSPTLDGAACESSPDGTSLCVLVEGEHYAIDYADTACAASGISILLGVVIQPGESIAVRYPRQVNAL